jgi:membrane protein
MSAAVKAGSRSLPLLAAATGLFILRFVARSASGARSDRPGVPAAGERSASQPRDARAPRNNAKPGARSEAGRGREADSPTDIPAQGWKDVLWRVWEEMGHDRLIAVAAGVTYYGLLAIFPAIAAFVSLYGLVADPSTIEGHLNSVSSILPGGAIDVIREQVQRIASQGGGTLGFGFVFGLLVSLWSANAGMKAVFDALNVVYDEEEKRSFIKLNLQSLTFTLGAVALLIVAIFATAVLPHLLDFVGLSGVMETLLSLLRWPLLLVLIMTGLAVLYRYGPSRDKAEWRWVSPGSVAAAVLWVVASMLFSWYASKFGSYNETYGSLGAVVGFMTWLWISTIVILLGAELNAETEHQTGRDSTVGGQRPMGARNAAMADTLGEAKS